VTDLLIACDRPNRAERLSGVAQALGCDVTILRTVEDAARVAAERKAAALLICARDARPLRALRRLRAAGFALPALVVTDETAPAPLQHLAAWAELVGSVGVLYAPFTDEEFAQALKQTMNADRRAG
jgi:CheY-like chemotaxis protein